MKPTLLLLLALSAQADTVTGKDNRVWNGKVRSLNGGALILVASFPSGQKTLTFGSKNLKSIEFNTTFNNPGKPPPVPLSTSEPFSGLVVFRDRSSTHCDNLRIDQDVACSSGHWQRDKVNRILVDQK